MISSIGNRMILGVQSRCLIVRNASPLILMRTCIPNDQTYLMAVLLGWERNVQDFADRPKSRFGVNSKFLLV